MSKPLRFELLVRGLGISALTAALALPVAMAFGANQRWMRLLVFYAAVSASFMAGSFGEFWPNA